jgi:hypothetical protein
MEPVEDLRHASREYVRRRTGSAATTISSRDVIAGSVIGAALAPIVTGAAAAGDDSVSALITATRPTAELILFTERPGI